MALRLILTRHAKSDWDDPKMDDHDRPLNARGVGSARAMGEWLHTLGHRPGQALVSTATRAVQTWNGMAVALDGTESAFDPRLYLATPDTVLSVLAGATADTVLVIGHNPGLAMLASALVARPPSHAGFRPYPTCATLVAEFDAPDWRAVGRVRGRVVTFAVPREVMGET